MADTTHDRTPRPVRIDVSRRAGWTRGPLAGPAGAIICYMVFRLWQRLHFDPTPASNRLPDYAFAVVYVTLAIVGTALLWHGLRWLTFALWPGPIEIVADEDGLTIPTGPIARRRYDWERMTLRYSFEIEADEEAFVFDSFMDEDEEPDARLPLMQHPESRLPLNVALERLIDVGRPTVIARLRPWTDWARRTSPDQNE